MNQCLKVKIRKRHEPLLRKRYDFGRIKRSERNSCSLCDTYFGSLCTGCPFNKFSNGFGDGCGCGHWLSSVMDQKERPFILGTKYIIVCSSDYEDAKKFIQTLKRRASKLITWY